MKEIGVGRSVEVVEPEIRTLHKKKSGVIGGFLKRVRSGSVGNRKVEKDEAPPAPDLPPFLAAFGSTSPDTRGQTETTIGSVGLMETPPRSKFSSSPKSDPPPTDEEDLASLLLLVHAAGDKFAADEYFSNDSPPGTPELSSSTFSSPGSNARPPTPKKYFTFLAHLAPVTPPESRRNLPPTIHNFRQRTRLLTPPPSPQSKKPIQEPDSDDEYGDAADVWPATSNAKFTKAVIIGSEEAVKVRGAESGRTLGPVAMNLLLSTSRKMSESSKPQMERPMSLTKIDLLDEYVRENGRGSRVMLGRMIVRRKLRRGLTLVEGMELERNIGSLSSIRADRSRKEVEEAARKLLLSDDTDEEFISALSDKFITGTQRPSELPTPSSLRKWISRPSFPDRTFVTLAVEGGVLLDLIRARKGQPNIAPSRRLRCLAGLDLSSPLKSDMSNQTDRPEREFQPGKEVGPDRRQRSLSDIAASSLNPLSILTKPSSHPSKLLLPGPLLLASLAKNPLENLEDEENTPLATLRQRSPLQDSALRIASPEVAAALKKAQGDAASLAAEVSRLRINESLMKEQWEKKDRDREESMMILELERKEETVKKALERRLAEQRRRSRIMGQPVWAEDKSAGYVGNAAALVRAGNGSGMSLRVASSPPNRRLSRSPPFERAPSPSPYRLSKSASSLILRRQSSTGSLRESGSMPNFQKPWAQVRGASTLEVPGALSYAGGMSPSTSQYSGLSSLVPSFYIQSQFASSAPNLQQLGGYQQPYQPPPQTYSPSPYPQQHSSPSSPMYTNDPSFLRPPPQMYLPSSPQRQHSSPTCTNSPSSRTVSVNRAPAYPHAPPPHAPHRVSRSYATTLLPLPTSPISRRLSASPLPTSPSVKFSPDDRRRSQQPPPSNVGCSLPASTAMLRSHSSPEVNRFSQSARPGADGVLRTASEKLERERGKVSAKEKGSVGTLQSTAVDGKRAKKNSFM